MANFTFLFFKEQVLKAKRVLILTHTDPDGDAIGSSLALKKIINSWGIPVETFFSGKINVNYPLKKEDKPKSESLINLVDFDLILILDTNNFSRTGLSSLKNSRKDTPVLIIDHHIKKNRDLKLKNVFFNINSKATATCEIIFDLLKEGEEKIDSEVASLLLLGIYTDSGCFFHSNTKPKLILKVKELLSRGVVFKNITQNAFKGKKVEVLKLIGQKITEAKINPSMGFIHSQIKEVEMEKLGISNEEIGGLVNLLNMCEEVKFALLITENKDGRIKGSLRSSMPKFIDVNIISRFLGGGGHKLASGFETFGKIVENGDQTKIH